MKRKVALRNLIRVCDCCQKKINKGSVFYDKRKVFVIDEGDESERNIVGYTERICAKCQYKKAQSEARYEEFKQTCTHPDQFVVNEYYYSPFPGGILGQRCILCGK